MLRKRQLIITPKLARRILNVVDEGLVPGQMCAEAAVCCAMNLPNGDNPTYADPVLRSLQIKLNDSLWASPEARAAALRRLAIAMLGTSETFKRHKFVVSLSEVIKQLKQTAATSASDDIYAKAVDAAAKAVDAAARAYAYAAAYASDTDYAAAYTAYAATFADYAVAAARANAASYAAANADSIAISIAYATRLAEFCEKIVQILVQMKTPGSKFLYLTE